MSHHDKSTADLLNLVNLIPHAENGQNLSISRMGTDMMSHHDKTTADLLNLMNLMPHAESGQNLSISRMGTDMLSHHEKTTADLLNLVNFMPNAENGQNLSISRMGTDTVKPLYSGHLRDRNIVSAMERCPLYRGSVGNCQNVTTRPFF